MQTLHFSIRIDAPRERIWDAMLGEQSFRDWTSVFAPGSHYVGDWRPGSKMLFLAPGEDGRAESGMVSRVREHRPCEYVSIEHLGVVEGGQEDTSGRHGWKGALENYRLRELDGEIEVLVDMDSEESFVPMFHEAWPRALQRLKEIAEGQG